MLNSKLISFFQLALCACLISGSMIGATAQTNDGVISDASVGPAGLTVDWFTQVEVAAGGHLIDIQMTVDENISTTIFDIRYGNHNERISENDLDAYGKPFGVKGAEAQANVRREIIEAELKAQNQTDVKVTIEKIVLPKTTLYAVNSHGVASALDGETGETLWVKSVGRRDFPTIGIGASTGSFVNKNNKSVYQSGRVAVVNGNTVYCLDASNGKLLWKEAGTWPMVAPPVVNESYIFVPTTTGRLQAFSIDKKGWGEQNFVSIGISTSRPLLTEKTVSWATDSGYYTVARVPANETTGPPKFRVNASSAILSTGSYHDELLFVTSKNGYIYAVDEARGSLQWELTFGEQIFQSPVAVGDNLYVFTRENNLYNITGKTGKLANGWEKPVGNITEYVGSSQSKLYVLDKRQKLNMLDLANGDLVNVIKSSPITLVCANTKSDRLYLGSKQGFIQCVREVGNEFPYFHSSETKKEETDAEKDNPFRTEKPAKDPFEAGGDNDPFKTTPKKNADEEQADPFKAGGANDPFKSGGSNDKDDPFKSGGSDDKDDPFKSGGG